MPTRLLARAGSVGRLGALCGPSVEGFSRGITPATGPAAPVQLLALAAVERVSAGRCAPSSRGPTNVRKCGLARPRSWTTLPPPRSEPCMSSTGVLSHRTGAMSESKKTTAHVSDSNPSVSQIPRARPPGKRRRSSQLFLGRLQLDLIHPHPEPDPEEQRRGLEFQRGSRPLRDEVYASNELDRKSRSGDQGCSPSARSGSRSARLRRLGLSPYTYATRWL